jgi:hypothetical protein
MNIERLFMVVSKLAFGSLNDEDLPRGHGDYVTASGTIITLA